MPLLHVVKCGGFVPADFIVEGTNAMILTLPECTVPDGLHPLLIGILTTMAHPEFPSAYEHWR